MNDKKIRSERAKQGRWGGQVLLILVVGLVLAMVAWGAVELYWLAIAPDTSPVQVETNPQPG